jgi:hypothetical protein
MDSALGHACRVERHLCGGDGVSRRRAALTLASTLIAGDGVVERDFAEVTLIVETARLEVGCRVFESSLVTSMWKVAVRLSFGSIDWISMPACSHTTGSAPIWRTQKDPDYHYLA